MVISCFKSSSAVMRAAVPNLASSNALNNFCAFSSVASIKISKSKVARGTPCKTAAIPPMTRYLTLCVVKDENTSCNWLSIFAFRDSGIIAQNQIRHKTKIIHPFLKRKRLKPACFRFLRFFLSVMRNFLFKIFHLYVSRLTPERHLFLVSYHSSLSPSNLQGNGQSQSQRLE